MATTTKKVLSLKFGYSSDATAIATVNINAPATDLTDELIKTAMTSVVSAGALAKLETSAVNKIVEANYINTETEEIAL